METIDFSKLIRHLWVILLGMLLGATAAFLYTGLRPADYQVQARLLVGPGIDSARPDLDVLRASGQLILTYAELPLTEPFLQELIEELNLERQPEDLARMISVKPNPETQILTIEVRSSDAEEAQSIAYLTAEKLVTLSPSNPESTAAQVKGQLQTQVSELEKSVAETKQSLFQMELDYQKTLTDERQQRENGVFSEAIFEQLDRFEKDTTLIADAGSQRKAGIEILEELVANTNGRIVQFEYELEQTANPITQKIISEQIRLERIHLSDLRQTIADINTPIEGMPLDQYITGTQQQINELNEGLAKIFTYDLRRLQYDQINQLQTRLSAARAIETARQERILSQIAGERERISDVALSRIENQRQIQERITLERSRLTEMQNTLAILYNSADAPDPNQVKVIELASPVAVVAPMSLMVLVGMFAGAFLGAAGILSFGAMNNIVETSEQVTRHIPAHVVDITTGYSQLASLFSRKLAQKKALEKYQMLGMHLIYGQGKIDRRIILIGSADSHADSGIVAANLAVFLAQSGKRVILVDANIDQPTVAGYFGLERQEGLSELLAGSSKRILPVAAVESYPTLVVLPFGNSAPNMMFLNVPQLMTQLESLKDRVDMVLVSAPPLLRPDSLALASRTAGVVVVVAKGKTSLNTLTEVAENLSLVGAKPLSAALTSHPLGGDRLALPKMQNASGAVVQPISRPRPSTDKREGSEPLEKRAAS